MRKRKKRGQCLIEERRRKSPGDRDATVAILQSENQYSVKMIIKMSEGGTVLRRNLPGTKAADYSKWKEEPFEEMDSTLVVQQYIQQTIRKDPKGW